MPVTFYASDSDLPDFENYDMANRTCRYFTGKPLFPFGHGLSFTSFEYAWKEKPANLVKSGDTISGSVIIKNIGKLAGDEVAQLYIQYPKSSTRLPLKELQGFERFAINPDESVEWQFSIPTDKLKKWDQEAGQLLVPAGEYTLFVGTSSSDMAITSRFTIE